MTKDRLITEYIKIISYLCELRAEDIKPERIAIWANTLAEQRINIYAFKSTCRSLSYKSEPRLSLPIILSEYNSNMEALVMKKNTIMECLKMGRELTPDERKFLVQMCGEKEQKTLQFKGDL